LCSDVFGKYVIRLAHSFQRHCGINSFTAPYQADRSLPSQDIVGVPAISSGNRIHSLLKMQSPFQPAVSDFAFERQVQPGDTGILGENDPSDGSIPIPSI
jgi:hypothetical protein